MSEAENARLARRYVALDIHKHYSVVAGVNRDGQVQLAAVRVEHEDLEDWLKKTLKASDEVVIESTTNAWHVKEDARNGLTTQQFARYYLMKLGIGHDLTRIALDPKHPRRLASEAEVLALRPELRQIE